MGQATTFLEVTPEQFFSQITARFVVAYFWGPNCPNCDVFKSAFTQFADEVPEGITLIKINAYEHTELATRYSLFGVPAFLLFHHGKLLGRMSQFEGKDAWLQVLSQQLDRVSTD